MKICYKTRDNLKDTVVIEKDTLVSGIYTVGSEIDTLVSDLKFKIRITAVRGDKNYKYNR